MTRCSVILPTFRRPGPLAACLAGLAAQRDAPPGLEVVVVDDGGGIPLESSLTAVREGLDVTLLVQPNQGPAAARNAAARQARGELLAFIDDDCVPRPDWLRGLLAMSDRAPEAAVSGHTVNALPGNPYAAAAQLVLDVGYEQTAYGQRGVPFFATNNLLVPAAGFRELGGFDPAFRTAEDRDFCARWSASGRAFAHAREAVVEHAHPMGLLGFVRLHYAYGRGSRRFHHAQAARGGSTAVEPSYYLALARRPLRERGRRRLGLAGLLAAWFLATTAGFAHELASERR